MCPTIRPSIVLLLALACSLLASPEAAGNSSAASMPSGAPPDKEDGPAWFAAGREAARARGAGSEDARNLVLFVGDGMGPTTVTAARILAGQRGGGHGEEAVLAFERFPHSALAKTYNTDAQTPDSAGTMTAMLAGIKTRKGVLGLGPEVRRGRCAPGEPVPWPSLLARAHAVGLSTGIVTTTRVTHATPAAAYAHTQERDWEADGQLGNAARRAGCRDIAVQLVDALARGWPQVVLGGGAAMFRPAAAGGMREDGRALLDEWAGSGADVRRVDARAELLALPVDGAPVVGLFGDDHLAFEDERQAKAPDQPSLAEMTKVAIERLAARGRPFVLVVEGGRIDHAHHQGRAALALGETVALADAVAVADRLTSADDTLIIVTADHSHTLTFAGYSVRGNPILGLASDSRGPRRDLDGNAYTTLGYANGPGARIPLGSLDAADTRALDFRQPARVALEDETHGGEDVAVYARGPGAVAVRGVFEQHVLFHVMAESLPPLRAARPPSPAGDDAAATPRAR